MEKQKVYSIRKIKNGVASVAIATAFFALGTSQVSAEELQSVSEMTVELELIPTDSEDEIVAEEEIIEANAEIVDGASGEDESEVVEEENVTEVELGVVDTEELLDDEILEKNTELAGELEKEDEKLMSEKEDLAEEVKEDVDLRTEDHLEENADLLIGEDLDDEIVLDMHDDFSQENTFNYEEYYKQMVLEKRNSIIDISTDKEIYKSGDIIKLRATVKEYLFDGDFSVTFYNTKKVNICIRIFPNFSR